MMKKSNMIVPMALASIGVGSLLYSYVKMHPVKAKVMAQKAKSMMKDFS